MENCYHGCYLELDNLCLSLKDTVQGRLGPISFGTVHVIPSMTKDGLARFIPFRPAAFLCSVHSLSKQPRLSNNNYIQFSIFGTLPHLLSYFRITYPRVPSNFDRRLFIAASSSCASRPPASSHKATGVRFRVSKPSCPSLLEHRSTCYRSDSALSLLILATILYNPPGVL
jgi:hypothetical protein